MIRNKKNKTIVMIILMIICIIFVIIISEKKYNINEKIGKYDLYSKKNEYLDFLKMYIKPSKLQKYIDNGFINLSLYKKDATGNDIMLELYSEGYENLMITLFDKSRTNFDDCPVTEKFKEKFNTNLLEYFKLIASEDCASNCLLDCEKQEITVEVYGNFENTEPTYQNTHHFHYTLDSDGNVDDVVFDYTEE